MRSCPAPRNEDHVLSGILARPDRREASQRRRRRAARRPAFARTACAHDARPLSRSPRGPGSAASPPTPRESDEEEDDERVHELHDRPKRSAAFRFARKAPEDRNSEEGRRLDARHAGGEERRPIGDRQKADRDGLPHRGGDARPAHPLGDEMKPAERERRRREQRHPEGPGRIEALRMRDHQTTGTRPDDQEDDSEKNGAFAGHLRAIASVTGLRAAARARCGCLPGRGPIRTSRNRIRRLSRRRRSLPLAGRRGEHGGHGRGS